MICCRGFFRALAHPQRGKSVLPAGWILPVRLFALVNLIGNMAFIILDYGNISLKVYFVLGIHLTIIWSMLKECRHSAGHYDRLAAEAKQSQETSLK